MDKSLRKIGFTPIWQEQDGSKGVNIGWIDTGAPSLQNVSFWDWKDDQPPSPPYQPPSPSRIKAAESTVPGADPWDRHGHGTLIAKVMLMNPTDWPIQPQTKVGGCYRAYGYSIKALSDDGRGQYSWILKAIQNMVEKHPVDVVNMSLGGPTHSPELDEAIRYAYFNKGVIFCVAAGNTGTKKTPFLACDRTLNCPGDAKEAVMSGATSGGHEGADDKGNPLPEQVQTWSSRLPSQDGRTPPESGAHYIVAPGLNISVPGRTGAASGTSLAAPHNTVSAAAVIWRIIQKRPELRRTKAIVDMVREALEKTALELTYRRSGNWTEGEAYCIEGKGRVQPYEAIKLIDQEPKPPERKGSPSKSTPQKFIIHPKPAVPPTHEDTTITAERDKVDYISGDDINVAGKLTFAKDGVGLAQRKVTVFLGGEDKYTTTMTDANGFYEVSFIAPDVREDTESYIQAVFEGDP